MKINRLLLLTLVSGIIISCNKNDDDPAEVIPPRDRGEVAVEDDQELIDYMSTHFYNYEEFENPSEGFDYQVVIDTIAGENSDKTPIINSDKLLTKTVNYQGVDQQLYILKIREGVEDKPHFSDSTFVSFKGELLDGQFFSNNPNSPVWFDLTSVIQGFQEGLQEFRSGSGYEVNDDNTITWNNDYGLGLLFVPSGLGYFNSPQPGSIIPTYAPLVFHIKLYSVNIADHDNDGIPSYLEDLNGDMDLMNDDTDGDQTPNYADADDDGDGKPTREEIEINEETGEIILTDSNNDGTPDYLDPDVFE